MIQEIEFTHYGWFGICPAIYSDLDTEQPRVEPRWRVLAFLFIASEFMQHAYMSLRSKIDDDYEPEFILSVSGEFKKPYVRKFKIDDGDQSNGMG